MIKMFDLQSISQSPRGKNNQYNLCFKQRKNIKNITFLSSEKKNWSNIVFLKRTVNVIICIEIAY
jgi:hypothetical protein